MTFSSRHAALACWSGRLILTVIFLVTMSQVLPAQQSQQVLPSTQPLAERAGGLGDWNGVIDAEINRAVLDREKHWHRDLSSPENYRNSIAENRNRLAHIIGLRDERVPFASPTLITTLDSSSLVGKGATYDIHRVSWPAFGDVVAEGLLLEPRGRKPLAAVVAVPDCACSPEQIVGLADGVPAESQFARRLAESGCRVLVPTLIDRTMEVRGKEGYRDYSRQLMSSREYLFRPAYMLGRHLIGYEVQQLLAAVDWFSKENEHIGVIGHGEGGMIALFAAAVDERIDATCVSGYIDSRQMWNEPFDRSVFSLLLQYGDAELITMVTPRAIVVEACRCQETAVTSPGGSTGAIRSPNVANVRAEITRARNFVTQLRPEPPIELVESGDGQGPYGSEAALRTFLSRLSPHLELTPSEGPPRGMATDFNPSVRQAKLLHQIDRHNQWLLSRSGQVRRKFMNKLDSSTVASHESTKGWYVEHIRREVLGRLKPDLLSINAKTRLRYDEPKWTCYEVQLDVFPGANAFGYLIIPKGLQPDEKRPVVICQHGGGGHPEQLVKEDAGAYHSFAARLAEEGFVTFAPAVMFPPSDNFVRKCNSIGLTQYAYIAAMHQQIVNWLKTQSFVDGDHIGLYGLSWGGKTAIRMPLLVDGYCLTIVSGDFNEWIWKTTTTDSDYSYVFQPEPYIFEFDLGSTYGYAEMAALIAPRPFMVERGHFDPVGSDEQVGLEYAKVQHLYHAQLKLAECCGIAWFDGGHEINLPGTLDFLKRHLMKY